VSQVTIELVSKRKSKITAVDREETEKREELGGKSEEGMV
jgi:hypothetical protein